MKHEQLFCSPENAKFSFEDDTCFSFRDLKLIAIEYNRHISTKQKIRVAGTKKDLLLRLRKAFEPQCGKHEFCWIDTLGGKVKQELHDTFRPPMPTEWYKDRTTWLNTYDILNVLTQYEKLYKNFMFCGVFPMDFENHDANGVCHGDAMCTFKVSDMKRKKKTKFAMVLNTDYSHQSGSHWVALACDIDKKSPNYGIFYYDSTASPPPREAEIFMEKIKLQVADNKFIVAHNTVVAQRKGFACGVYAIVFVTQFVKDVPFQKICKGMKRDDDVNKLRNILYRPSEVLHRVK